MKNDVNRVGHVYMITSPKGRIYIGSTTQKIEQRWRLYKTLNCKKQVKLYNSLKKYGPENHIFEIIWSGNIEELYAKETILGNFYNVLDKNVGLNSRLPKLGDMYKCMSDSQKKKISMANKGKKRSLQYVEALRKRLTGRKVSSTTKEKQRQNMLGKKYSLGYKHTAEAIEKLRILGLSSNKGKKLSKEQKLKLKGNKNALGNSISPILQYDLNNNFIKEWKSITEAVNYYGSFHISSCCSGKRKTAKGFIWKRKKENNSIISLKIINKMININRSELAKDIANGKRKEDLRIKYSTEEVILTLGDVSRILKAAGLRVKRLNQPKFKIVDDVQLPLDPTIAKEVKEEAEQGNTLVDLSGEFSSLSK